MPWERRERGTGEETRAEDECGKDRGLLTAFGANGKDQTGETRERETSEP